MRAFFAEGQFETDEGERLTLVCDFYALKVIEEVTGQDWDEIVPQLVKPPKYLAAQVLYGLLRKRQENITLNQAAGLFYDKNSIALWAIMGDVIGRACNFEREEGEEEPAPAKKKAKWSIARFRKEWIGAGFSPAEFWDETPVSFVNAMEGAALRSAHEYELSIAQAWHMAKFNALAQVGKLKGLKSYIGKATTGKRSIAADALAFFHSLRARGIPVKIERVERKPKESADG